jgi:hypothetical protein
MSEFAEVAETKDDRYQWRCHFTEKQQSAKLKK